MNLAKTNHSLTNRRREGLGARAPFWALQNEMNSLFDQFFSPERSDQFFSSQMNWPAIEVQEEENQYRICAEIPGVEEKDIQLSIDNNVLEISGERRQEINEKDEDSTFSEISYGKFYRTIPFDHDVNELGISAQLKDGLLKVTIPKNAEDKKRAKKIEITH